MARYGEAFRNRAVARLLPLGSANVGAVAKEIGVSVRAHDSTRGITAAALDEIGKSTWCREHGVYPAELDKWRSNATTALTEPEEARASP